MKKSELIQLALDSCKEISYMCVVVEQEARNNNCLEVGNKIIEDIHRSLGIAEKNIITYVGYLRNSGASTVYTDYSTDSDKRAFISFMRRKRLEFMRDQYILKGE